MTLKKLQAYVRKAAKERGFDEETVGEKFQLLLEETGEFAKAARKREGNIKSDRKSQVYDPASEAADILFVLVDLCNSLGIDIEQAFNDKEQANSERVWE